MKFKAIISWGSITHMIQFFRRILLRKGTYFERKRSLVASSSHFKLRHQFFCPLMCFRLFLALLESKGSFSSLGQSATQISLRQGNRNTCEHMLLNFGRESRSTISRLEKTFTACPNSSPMTSSNEGQLYNLRS